MAARPSYEGPCDRRKVDGDAVFTQPLVRAHLLRRRRGRDANNAAQEEQLARYRSIQRRFAHAGGKRSCEVIRSYSGEAATRFERDTFDWVYVDANHGYDACLQGLRVWGAKVKPDGFLCGHDFARHAAAARRFGVVEALFAFLEETGFHLLAVTVEHFPTFVIVKDRTSAGARRFLDLLLTFEPRLLAVPQGAVRNFHQARLLGSRERRATLMRFGV